MTACLTAAGGLLFWAFFGIPRREYARAAIQGPGEGVDRLCSLSFLPLRTPTTSPSSSAAHTIEAVMVWAIASWCDLSPDRAC